MLLHELMLVLLHLSLMLDLMLVLRMLFKTNKTLLNFRLEVLLVSHPAFIDNFSRITEVSIRIVLREPRVFECLRFDRLVLSRLGVCSVIIRSAPFLMMLIRSIPIITSTSELCSKLVRIITILVSTRVIILLVPTIVQISHRSILI